MQQDEGVRRAPRGIERANTTHRATRWAKGVQKWQKTAAYLPKPTVAVSVPACFAVRQNGAGEHDDLVTAVALVGRAHLDRRDTHRRAALGRGQGGEDRKAGLPYIGLGHGDRCAGERLSDGVIRPEHLHRAGRGKL